MLIQNLTAKQFFQRLHTHTMHLVDAFYDVEAVFQDPLVILRSSQEIKNYYTNMYKNVEMINFTFSDDIKVDNKNTLVWRMTLRAINLNRGKPIDVEGVSIIHFGGSKGKAIYHRDYFDIGEFVYEELPIIGGMIRHVKKKMATHKGDTE